MSFYRDRVLPSLIDHVMRGEAFSEQRTVALSRARGKVLEIGFGTGLNLPHYPSTVTHLIALDPVPAPENFLRRNRAGNLGSNVSFDLEEVQGVAESIPLGDESVDTVVTTWTLCSVEDPARALAEIRRVLKPGGLYLFLEHGRAPERWVAKAQDLLTPLQKVVAGGCHLNRDIDGIVAESGLVIDGIERFYMSGPRIATFLYRGSATKN